jgi:hypothetical protein
MLDLIAPIYRRLIYEFLSLEELAKLGQTCKTIYQDKNRNETIVSKISCKFRYEVDEYFVSKISCKFRYEIDEYYSRNIYFSYSLMPKYLVEPILQEFKKRILSLKFEEIENMSFEEKRYLVIHFPIELFVLLDNEYQKEIVLFFCDQLYHMWKYAEKNKMDMSIYEYRYPERFVLYPFYNFIKNSLEEIFIEGSENIKCILIHRLIELTNITKNIFPKKRIENDIDIEIFIYSLFRGNISQLKEIIDIGLFLQKCFPTYLRNYLDNIIGSYLEINDSYEDIYADAVEEILGQKNKTYPELTNAEVLDELLLECKLFSVSLLYETNKRRQERLIKNDVIEFENF